MKATEKQCKDHWNVVTSAVTKTGLRACLFKFVVCAIVYKQLFASDVSLSRFCNCVVLSILSSWSVCFLKHLLKRSCCRHNIRCIVMFTWNKAWIVDEAHSIELSWNQPIVEFLAITAFCFLTRANGPVFKLCFGTNMSSSPRTFSL